MNSDSMMSTAKRIDEVKSEILDSEILENKNKTYVLFIRMNSKNSNYVHIKRRKRVSAAMIADVKRSDVKVTISDCFKNYEDVDSEKSVYTLSKHESQNHDIDLKSDKIVSYDSIYSLSKNELIILKAYLEKHLKNDFIRSSQSSIEISIMFIKKKNESLRLCVNYRVLNAMTIKNRYSLSLIEKSLDRLSKIVRYTALNLTAAYHRVRIRKDDE